MRDTRVGRGGRAERDTFLGMLSHELRTPVTTIYAGARLLARGEPLSSTTRRELASNIGAEAERLFRLIEDLLVIARAERGILEAEDERITLRPILAEMARLEATQWQANPFVVEARDDLPAVSGDQRHVRQVVRNLLGHAAALRLEGEPIRVSTEPDGDSVRVRITIRRPSDPAAAAPRLDLPATDASAGPIGLLASRELVQSMNGELWVRSNPGGGLEVGFALPTYRPLA